MAEETKTTVKAEKPKTEKPEAKKSKVQAVARAVDARISTKHSMAICKELRGKRLENAKALLEDMSMGKRNIAGKYYTKASTLLLEILNSAGANAMQLGMDAEKLVIAVAKPNKGRIFMRPRTRAKLRGRAAKSTNIEIILEERQGMQKS